MSDAEPVETKGDAVATLRASLPEGVGLERTTAGALPGALDRAVERPAVGTPLSVDGVALDDAGIDRLPAGDAARERGWLLREAATGVTPAGLGIAARGSVSVRSRGAGDELVSLYPERHVAVLRASDVVPDVRTAFERMGERARASTHGDGDEETTASEVLTTGPSATADMGALVQGVHGPREVCVLVVEDR